MPPKIEELKTWIRTNTPENLSVLIPVSGGSDSALLFWLYNQVMPQRTLGVRFGNDVRARAWFDSIGKLDIRPTPVTMPDAEIARWAMLLEIALNESRVLIGARNKTEDTLGMYSHASRISYHLPLANIWKSDVLTLCEAVGVPKEITDSSRKADIACGRTVEFSAIPIEKVDAYLQGSRDALAGAERDYIDALLVHNKFKHQLPLK